MKSIYAAPVYFGYHTDCHLRAIEEIPGRTPEEIAATRTAAAELISLWQEATVDGADTFADGKFYDMIVPFRTRISDDIPATFYVTFHTESIAGDCGPELAITALDIEEDTDNFEHPAVDWDAIRTHIVPSLRACLHDTDYSGGPDYDPEAIPA